MRIPVVEGQKLHSGVRIMTGSIPIKLLANIYEVPYRDALKKKGYQRKPQEMRINRFANELLKGQTDVPTSILLNIREGMNELLQEVDEAGIYLDFENVSLENVTFYVVDGQHRVLAFNK